MAERILARRRRSPPGRHAVGVSRSGGISRDRCALGAAALKHLSSATYDAVVLDLMLPDMDGLDVCRQLRTNSDTPVLMLSGRGDAVDRIVGLEIGADDYLPKPFEPRELLARLRAILRRGRRGDCRRRPILAFRPARNRSGGRARCASTARPCDLTGYQFDCWWRSQRKAGRVLSRDMLMDLVKGEQPEAFDRSIDVHMSRIRAAIEDDPKKPRPRDNRPRGRLRVCQGARLMLRLYLRFYLALVASLVLVRCRHRGALAFHRRVGGTSRHHARPARSKRAAADRQRRPPSNRRHCDGWLRA